MRYPQRIRSRGGEKDYKKREKREKPEVRLSEQQKKSLLFLQSYKKKARVATSLWF